MEWWPYLCWSFGVAGAAFAAMAWPGLWVSDRRRDDVGVLIHLRDDKGWVDGFLHAFDRVFGAKALSWERLWRSALASTLGVAALWVLFGPVLGMMDTRADSPLPLAKAVLFGLAVNVAADWLSLIETRWLLARFAHWRSLPAQLGLLVLDLVFTGAVIVVAVNTFRWIEGAPLLHPVEMMAGYSAWAIFFYSTFLTSVWAWAYALGMIAVRVFSSKLGYSVFDHKRPFNSLATLAAVATMALLVGGEAARRYVLPKDVDIWLCDMIGGVMCTHLARLTPDERAAMELLGQACLTGDPLQCRRAYEGLGGEQGDRALQLVETACLQADDARACVTVGYNYQNGIGAPPDLDRARDLFDRACIGGQMTGCTNLGVLYEQGLGVSVDLDRARDLYDRACTGGDMLGCKNLGGLYHHGLGVPADLDRARALYDRACTGGEMGGCSSLGFIYDQGIGVAADLDLAAAYYDQACNGGNMIGCSNLGYLYWDEGRNFRHDLNLARSLFDRACTAGNMWSCTKLGYMYARGRGIVRDIVLAQELFDRACRGGDMLGCTNLGFVFEQDQEVPHDFERARALYDLACDGGDMTGCERIGFLYQFGLGVRPDRDRAISYFDHACSGGLAEACAWRDALP